MQAVAPGERGLSAECFWHAEIVKPSAPGRCGW